MSSSSAALSRLDCWAETNPVVVLRPGTKLPWLAEEGDISYEAETSFRSEEGDVVR